LLADDQALLRAGFRALIDSTDDLTVVGEASDGAEAVSLARSARADVVLMDVRMPGMDGLAATAAITGDDALAGVKVIVLTTFEIDEYVVQAIRGGASGFLGKGVGPAELLDAIRVVFNGEALLSPKATSALIAHFATAPQAVVPANPDVLDVLTSREREIVKLVARGLTNDEIAEQLFISPLTARTHVHRAMTKLDARDRAQLVVAAYQSGLMAGEQMP
jgi:DNA-binding NarL/FixJ family response regulator